MSYFTFRESVDSNLPLENNTMVYFDTEQYTTKHHLDSTEEIPDDYEYIEEGEDKGAFVIKMPGPHLMVWTVAQMTGRSQEGNFFQLKYKVDNEWVPISGKVHLKSSSTTGMGMLMVYPSNEISLPDGGVQLDEEGKLLFGLFNISGKLIQINREHYMKASMIVLGLGALGPKSPDQMQGLLDRFANTDNFPVPEYTGDDTPPIVRRRMATVEEEDKVQNDNITGPEETGGLLALFEKATTYFEQMTRPSVPINLRSTDIPGLGVSVLNTGHIYNFWNIGYVDTYNPVDPETSKVYLARAKDDAGNILFEPLTWIAEGTKMEGMCYVKGSAPYDFMPIYFDNTGVYLEVPAGYQFNPGSTYSFVRTLILTRN